MKKLKIKKALSYENVKDQYHQIAKELFPRARTATEVWITEAILIEIGNGLSTSLRREAVRFISNCYATPNIFVKEIDTKLLFKATELYSLRQDKT